jgi:eukaryotic-like serine/threonine-protein kinase
LRLIRRTLRRLIQGLILLLVGLLSAVLAMRFAIHGREVSVPQLRGLTPAQAQARALSRGLILSPEGKFFSAYIPQGLIMSQMPPAESKVRRGWKVRVAESLGPQRADVPNLVGQSTYAAEINIRRRGLDLGAIGEVQLHDASTGLVIAQSPSPEALNVVSPHVNLLTAAKPEPVYLVMPDFVGRRLADVSTQIEKAGLPGPRVQLAPQPEITSTETQDTAAPPPAQIPSTTPDEASSANMTTPTSTTQTPALDVNPVSLSPQATTGTKQAGLIIRQSPGAGSKISKETQITFQIAR